MIALKIGRDGGARAPALSPWIRHCGFSYSSGVFMNCLVQTTNLLGALKSHLDGHQSEETYNHVTSQLLYKISNCINILQDLNNYE